MNFGIIRDDTPTQGTQKNTYRCCDSGVEEHDGGGRVGEDSSLSEPSGNGLGPVSELEALRRTIDRTKKRRI